MMRNAGIEVVEALEGKSDARLYAVWIFASTGKW